MKNNWSQITIGEYQKLSKLANDFSKSIDDIDALLDYNCEVIGVLLGLTICDVGGLNLEQYQKYLDEANKIIGSPCANEIKESYDIGGIKYYIHIPTADNNVGLENIASKNVRNFITLLNRINVHHDLLADDKFIDHIDDIHNILALMLIPNGKTYGSGDFSLSDNADNIRDNMLICDALAVCGFFLTKYENLIKDTLLCSHYKMTSEAKRMKKTDKIGSKKMKEMSKELKHYRHMLKDGDLRK